MLGSYSSSPSSESASIKYIDEDITTVTDSTTFEHLETSAEIHPVPKAIEPGIMLLILEVRNCFHVRKKKQRPLFISQKTTADTWSVTHHLGISYYVNFLGRLGTNGFQLK